jgi:hypothetical protein
MRIFLGALATGKLVHEGQSWSASRSDRLLAFNGFGSAVRESQGKAKIARRESLREDSLRRASSSRVAERGLQRLELRLACVSYKVLHALENSVPAAPRLMRCRRHSCPNLTALIVLVAAAVLDKGEDCVHRSCVFDGATGRSEQCRRADENRDRARTRNRDVEPVSIE